MAGTDRRYVVKGIRLLTDRGGRVDWSRTSGLIAFDRLGPDGYYDVCVMKPDGSGVACLTGNKVGLLPQRHNGNPAWHPSGDYLVFLSEKESHPGDSSQASPGAGLWNDLWIATADGRDFHQLTDLPVTLDGEPPGAAQPHFFRDGQLLLWTQKGDAAATNPSAWMIKVARFVVGAKPRLENIRTYQPGHGQPFYETHDFTPDGKGIVFSGNLEPGQAVAAKDIYVMDLATGQLHNLTASLDEFDEHAHVSPAGDCVVWMTTKGQGIALGSEADLVPWLQTDYWIMNADGSGQRRLTYFNEPGHQEYYPGGHVIAADCDWSPDGQHIVAYYHAPLQGTHADGRPRRGRAEHIVVIDFA